MKIFPVSLSVYKNQKSNNIKTTSPVNMPPNLNAQKDTVSFKALKNMVQMQIDELDKNIKNNIDPFMQDSRELYLGIGKIGLAAQNIKDTFENEANNLFHKQMDIFDIKNNPYVKKYKKYTSRETEFKDNIKKFNQLLSVSQIPMYDKPHIKNAFEQAKNTAYFESNDEIEKIKPLTNYFNNSYKELNDKISNVTFQKNNPDLFEEILKTKDILMNAQYFMFITPYHAAVKLKMKKDEIEKDMNNPKNGLLKNLDTVDRLHSVSDSVIKSTKIYYKNKSSIETFVYQYNDIHAVLPSENEIKSAYKKLLDKSNELLKEQFSNTDEFYQKEYKDKKVTINLQKIDKTLKMQKKIIRELQKLVEKG